MLLSDGAATAAATRTRQCTFDGQDELTSLGQVGLEDPDIRNIQRDGDKGLFGHHDLPLL
jgi:hypothetical protein